jgi:hypothetical protein
MEATIIAAIARLCSTSFRWSGAWGICRLAVDGMIELALRREMRYQYDDGIPPALTPYAKPSCG